MNIILRVLLAVYAFFLTIASMFAMLVTIKSDILSEAYTYLYNDVLAHRNPSIIMFIVSSIFFCLSLTFLLSGFKPEGDKKAIIKYNKNGDIRITLNSIENIALATSRKLNGIRDSKAFVTKVGEGVSITVKAIVLPDINIPLLSEDMQQKVKSAVEDCTGVQVDSVRVLVESIFTGYKSARVE
ncbi:alkaline shock response membrane anchor protein AmaP [Ruminiclostridium josui]|uniref:alkaline shock response membrane anchor protein AmaP n=1 Tax=Ruminiclostridium josui TaxID=1499 RepID=UPI000465F43F|nr:alkaline shock response membrane anchor protein AmaP [Ruminiclostridium josui]